MKFYNYSKRRKPVLWNNLKVSKQEFFLKSETNRKKILLRPLNYSNTSSIIRYPSFRYLIHLLLKLWLIFTNSYQDVCISNKLLPVKDVDISIFSQFAFLLTFIFDQPNINIRTLILIFCSSNRWVCFELYICIKHLQKLKNPLWSLFIYPLHNSCRQMSCGTRLLCEIEWLGSKRRSDQSKQCRWQHCSSTSWMFETLSWQSRCYWLWGDMVAWQQRLLYTHERYCLWKRERKSYVLGVLQV